MYRRLPGAGREPGTTTEAFEFAGRHGTPRARFQLAEFKVTEARTESGAGDALREGERRVSESFG
jgi:hypothetical protein